jgi:hypothetical protein
VFFTAITAQEEKSGGSFARSHAPRRHLGQKPVRVEALPGQGEKKIVPLRQPRVGAEARHRVVGGTSEQFARSRLRDVMEGTWFHELFQSGMGRPRAGLIYA